MMRESLRFFDDCVCEERERECVCVCVASVTCPGGLDRLEVREAEADDRGLAVLARLGRVVDHELELRLMTRKFFE